MNASAALLRPRTPEEVAALLGGGGRFLAIGAGTKPALSAPPAGFTAVSLAGLSGIVEYDPGEYTFTALAGTPLAELQAALARNGQYLPFDPLGAAAGATLGGTIASGISGPGRLRYGGVRDFILGVRFVTGRGENVRGGGKVVKNAAGFDFPKLLVGSLGRLGIITEATFKVFPRPAAAATLRCDLPNFAAACALLPRLAAAPFDLEGLELAPPGRLWLRLSGAPATLPERLDRLEKFLGVEAERLVGEAEAAFWRAEPWTGLAGAIVAKVPVTLAVLADFDEALGGRGAGRRYSAGANVAWVSWPGAATELDQLLQARGLSGLVLQGPTPRPLLGIRREDPFQRRIKSALDPAGRFPDL